MFHFLLLNVSVQVLVATGAWWLSGYDPKVTHENVREDLIRRALRCGITLALVQAAFVSLWNYRQHNNRAAGVAYLATSLPLTFVWFGCASEFLARGIRWLIDPQDNREFDPRHGQRALDTIGDLIRGGRRDEAIRLCLMLKRTGAFSPAALDMTLEHLGVPQQRAPHPNPLAEIHRLLADKRFAEAELILHSLLARNPRHVEAAMTLMRLFAKDLHRPDKARKVLRQLEQQPHLDPAYLEFARRSILEWSQPAAETPVVEPPPESLDDLLAGGGFGTAIEFLEGQIREQPRDFELRLKLAEIHAVHCGQFQRAEKICRDAQAAGFSPEQIQQFQSKLREWKYAKRPVR